jgi:hypothetical protein
MQKPQLQPSKPARGRYIVKVYSVYNFSQEKYRVRLEIVIEEGRYKGEIEREEHMGCGRDAY